MKNMNTNYLIGAVIAVIVVGAAGFFGGMKYQQMKAPMGGNFRQFANGGGAPGQGRGAGGANGGAAGGNAAGRFGGGFRPVSGDIISLDDKSITVKTQDGSTRIVLLSDTTTINKADQATKADLKTGETVAVFGSDNSDGSVTAQSIQLNPMMRMMTNGSPAPSPSATPAAK